jgi:hypothetical protein
MPMLPDDMRFIPTYTVLPNLYEHSGKKRSQKRKAPTNRGLSVNAPVDY